MLRQYLPILIFLGLSAVIGLALFTLGWILGPRRPNAEKLSPYECGFEAFEDSRMRFDVRYYLVAIIFIVFDLEIAFFFPWGVRARSVCSPCSYLRCCWWSHWCTTTKREPWNGIRGRLCGYRLGARL